MSGPTMAEQPRPETAQKVRAWLWQHALDLYTAGIVTGILYFLATKP
jgi:hypothetical protein